MLERLTVPPSAQAAAVRLWLGRSDDSAGRAADWALLDPGERARALAITDVRVRSRYVAARAGIRRVLGTELGVAAESLEWGRLPCPRGCGSPAHGRPSLRRPEHGPEVGVSRSGAWWLLGVCDSGPLGVDLEAAEQGGGLVGAAAARRCFSARERRWLDGLPPADRPAALLRGWVRKESVSKAWGLGLGAELRAVEVLAGAWPPGAVQATVGGGGGPHRAGWLVEDLTVPDGLTAALARPVLPEPGPPASGDA
ncbi:4'-phosphopantetheinyl transferase superfamily protein [Streptomyces sp. JJ66]|uniref:4'-phosphopantetheinyl transferase family protein n=1 Tax=Streptomyces sp. JJ66 TaxID=2803843 RepID=UPI001C589E31|nr:4'-phosphopantetheinyl transferase superfamily protein [Streptomyces sp. JJ66]MBW1602245.1 4'-phosphopantetheinyl transferase superfamily protein [Streptomyces sp. JJ66]